MNKPPLWWVKITQGLRIAVKAAKESFYRNNVIIGFIEDDDGKKIGYLIRLPDEETGYYSRETLSNKELPIGVLVKNQLPEPEDKVEPPELGTFIYEVLREQVKLVPRLWLRKQIRKLLAGEELQPDITSFKQWVLLPKEKKENLDRIKMLETVVKVEGLKGLSRFNDYSDN